MLSVIIPTAYESETVLFQQAVDSLSKLKNVELICIDKSEAKTRAERLNLGFERAKGSMILFHHPRSFVDPKGIEYLVDHSDKVIWGAFTHQFDQRHFLLKFTSWYSNKIRGQGRSIFYLDHCIFFHRSLRKSPLPPVEIFEDTVLSTQLRNQQAPLLLPFKSTTSALRFTKNGIWRQAILNQIMKIGFYINASPQKMNKIYERGLNLNDPKKGTKI